VFIRPWSDAQREAFGRDVADAAAHAASGLEFPRAFPTATAQQEYLHGVDLLDQARDELKIKRALTRLRLSAEQQDEVIGRVRTKLFVGETPGISKYAGSGPLGAWLSTVAAREGISYLRSLDRDAVPAHDGLADPLEADPELQYLKATYRAAFRLAFHAALDALESRQRTLLKYQYLDGLTSRKIGKIYGVHHATAARWVQAAREALLEQTRAALMNELSIDAGEVDSVMRLIQSRWDVTVRRLLAPEPTKQ